MSPFSLVCFIYQTSTLFWVSSVGNDPQLPDHYFDDEPASKVDGFIPKNKRKHHHHFIKLVLLCALLGVAAYVVREYYPEYWHEAIGRIQSLLKYETGHYVEVPSEPVEM